MGGGAGREGWEVGVEGQALARQLCTMPPSSPAGPATAPPSLATQKTQFLHISIRSLGDPSTHPDVPMGMGIIGATSWNTVKIN